jgi:hypothetical protein
MAQKLRLVDHALDTAESLVRGVGAISGGLLSSYLGGSGDGATDAQPKETDLDRRRHHPQHHHHVRERLENDGDDDAGGGTTAPAVSAAAYADDDLDDATDSANTTHRGDGDDPQQQQQRPRPTVLRVSEHLVARTNWWGRKQTRSVRVHADGFQRALPGSAEVREAYRWADVDRVRVSRDGEVVISFVGPRELAAQKLGNNPPRNEEPPPLAAPSPDEHYLPDDTAAFLSAVHRRARIVFADKEARDAFGANLDPGSDAERYVTVETKAATTTPPATTPPPPPPSASTSSLNHCETAADPDAESPPGNGTNDNAATAAATVLDREVDVRARRRVDSLGEAVTDTRGEATNIESSIRAQEEQLAQIEASASASEAQAEELARLTRELLALAGGGGR